MSSLEEILKSHPVYTLRNEISKTNIYGFDKMKKSELITVMLQHPEKFSHIVMNVASKRQKGVRKEKPKREYSEVKKLGERKRRTTKAEKDTIKGARQVRRRELDRIAEETKERVKEQTKDVIQEATKEEKKEAIKEELKQVMEEVKKELVAEEKKKRAYKAREKGKPRGEYKKKEKKV